MLHELLKGKKIVLASASPRRRELLKLIGLSFIQQPANINETINDNELSDPINYVKRIANAKCDFISKPTDADCVVIAADTTVYINNQILGTPTDVNEAIEYLKLLSNQIHEVYTCITISYQGKIYSDVEKTKVKFMQLSDEMIHNYMKTKEPIDKAGAYGIQGYGSQFIEWIEGCYFNVMGFPMNMFYRLIQKI